MVIISHQLFWSRYPYVVNSNLMQTPDDKAHVLHIIQRHHILVGLGIFTSRNTQSGTFRQEHTKISMQAGPYRRENTRRNVHEGTYMKEHTRRNVHEGTYTKEHTRKNIHKRTYMKNIFPLAIKA